MRWGICGFSRLGRCLLLFCCSGARVLVTMCDPLMPCKHAWKVFKWYVPTPSIAEVADLHHVRCEGAPMRWG